eukprot:TRINITY_DN2246_c0_g1_i1.p1 TRINITY_DN2246_c0_g1~~TRINITY_DN2246_c0_g1_i1.p1  ORF type:complete len:183 (-),score=29.13 TRINITY_DN2246_c0_g1_i1:822-1298(-)
MHAPIYMPEKKPICGSCKKRSSKKIIDREPSMDDRIYKAVRYIEDASEGRQAHAYQNVNKRCQFYQSIITHPYYYYLTLVIILVHMALIIWEVPSSNTREELRRTKYQFADFIIMPELVCISFYIFDILIDLIDLGIRRFLHYQSRIFLFVWCNSHVH